MNNQTQYRQTGAVESSRMQLMLQQQLINESAGQQNQSAQAQAAAAQRYKTELCRSYQENGTCKYGEKCQFAHGYNELRSMMRHPKYKTELCRTFHAAGYCPYGPRCHFVHDINAAGSNENQRPTKWNEAANSKQYRSLSASSSSSSSSSVSPKPDSGLLMFVDAWESTSSSSSSASSTHELSPTSSRSLSPDQTKSEPHCDDFDFSTTLLVNQILNSINNLNQASAIEQQLNALQFLSLTLNN